MSTDVHRCAQMYRHLSADVQTSHRCPQMYGHLPTDVYRCMDICPQMSTAKKAPLLCKFPKKSDTSREFSITWDTVSHKDQKIFMAAND